MLFVLSPRCSAPSTSHPLEPFLVPRAQPDTASLQSPVHSRWCRAELCGNPSQRHAGLIQANGLIDLGLGEALASHGHASFFEDLKDTAFAEGVLGSEFGSGNAVQVVLDECLADVVREPEVQPPRLCMRLSGRGTRRLTCKFGQRDQAPAEVGSRGVAVSKGYQQGPGNQKFPGPLRCTHVLGPGQPTPAS